MEPTDNVVQVGCVGSVHATLRFLGRSAHSARPWQGENAIHRAGSFLAELASLPRREVKFDGFTFYEVFSVTRAQGGRARNVLPDLFELNLNYLVKQFDARIMFFFQDNSFDAVREDFRRVGVGVQLQM